jgi:thiamine-phosphate pyrophosphorylase
MNAAEDGADYVAFGGFFPSSTKDTKRIAGNDPEILRWWNEIMTVPSCAIGGITPENCGMLVEAGTDFLAVIAAVWNHPEGPGTAVKEFNRAIAAATPADA